MTSAEICRKYGWSVGTNLEGKVEWDGGWRKDRVEITAVGTDLVLARMVSYKHNNDDDWQDTTYKEMPWSLLDRRWEKVRARGKGETRGEKRSAPKRAPTTKKGQGKALEITP